MNYTSYICGMEKGNKNALERMLNLSKIRPRYAKEDMNFVDWFGCVLVLPDGNRYAWLNNIYKDVEGEMMEEFTFLDLPQEVQLELLGSLGLRVDKEQLELLIKGK
jgi:hypothetical protein